MVLELLYLCRSGKVMGGNRAWTISWIGPTNLILPHKTPAWGGRGAEVHIRGPSQNSNNRDTPRHSSGGWCPWTISPEWLTDTVFPPIDLVSYFNLSPFVFEKPPINILQCDDGAVFISSFPARLLQSYHTLNVFIPLPEVAVDEQQWSLSAQPIEIVFRKRNHPAIQSNSTSGIKANHMKISMLSWTLASFYVLFSYIVKHWTSSKRAWVQI